jgi:hypothetical protein
MTNEGKTIVKQGIITLAGTALGLVSALAWNDAIKAIISQVGSGEESLTSKISYAVIATLVAILVVYLLARNTGKDNNVNKSS